MDSLLEVCATEMCMKLCILHVIRRVIILTTRGSTYSTMP